MAEESATDTVAGIAERQYGVVCAGQLYALGLSKDQVSDRVRAGWLHRLHRGVYALVRRNLTPEGHWLAAVLAFGDEAVLSHASAAALWRIRRAPAFENRAGEGGARTDPIHVSVPSAAGRRPRPGLVVHRVATLASGECTVHRRIPVTTPVRTILDLATVLPRRQLERATDEAERLMLCSPEELAEIAAARSGRAGAGALGRLLREHCIGSTATRNDFEERFLALCRKRRLPQPEVNIPLLDYVVDFLWPESRLVVELDGRATHGTRRAFQEDRERDGRLAVAGYRVVRFTWFDVTRRPAIVADRVRRLLAQPVAP